MYKSNNHLFLIDLMHCVFLGIVKRMLLNLKYIKGRSSVDLQNLFDKSLVPSYIKRRPRNITEIANWKASEFRFFLIHLVPILKCIVESDQLICFALLSSAIKIMTSKLISESKIQLCQTLLSKFMELFELVFGLKNCTINYHSIMHLVDQIRSFGGLNNTSVFIFEDYYGLIRSWILGAHSQGKQVIRKYLWEKNKQIVSDPDFDFMGNSDRMPKRINMFGEIAVVLPIKEAKVTLQTASLIPASYFNAENQFLVSTRINFRGTKYQSLLYPRKGNKNNYTVGFSLQNPLSLEYEQHFGEIQRFIIPRENNEKVLAEVLLYEYLDDYHLLAGLKSSINPELDLIDEVNIAPFFYGVRLSDSRSLIEVEQISALAILAPLLTDDSVFYISLFNSSFDYS